MKIATQQVLKELDALAEERRQRILTAPDTLMITGTAYYVSNAGSDENDGLTPSTAWQTLAKASAAALCPGDGVLLCRGDLFRGTLRAQSGVSYGAYGEGPKPKIYVGTRDLADPALWEVYDKERSIFRLRDTIRDVGTLVFNGGEAVAYKLIPSYIGGRFVCRLDEERVFDVHTELERDLDMYWEFAGTKMTTAPDDQAPVPDMYDAPDGYLYLRCDRGNPGEVFASIEAAESAHGIVVGGCQNVCIENLTIRYAGRHGIAAVGVCVSGLHVRGCELGWIGGVIHSFTACDPNFPEAHRGSVARFGNAIEIYGGCDDYVVEDCYIYQCYDAGITHQVSTFGQKRTMTNILYKNNLIEHCVYSIEYFLDTPEDDTECYMDGVDISGNILRFAGEGWGQQRHNAHTPAHIKGWSYTNPARSFVIRDNVFDRAAYQMIHAVAKKQESAPTMQGNTYIQYRGGMVGRHGGNEIAEPEILFFDEAIDEKLVRYFGERDAKAYMVDIYR